jgi:CoA:oxalate CoA-transferase
MQAPLHGVRVVDFTRVLAGPHCTKTLRDLGADVTKIEPPSGDVGRVGVPMVGPMSLYFAQQNAGKRNLSVDLNWPEARRIVSDLCAQADVVVENFRPGTLARFGLAYDDVAQRNPGVVYVSLSGYGQTGPWRNRPAYAVTVQAETGLTDTLTSHFGEALAALFNDPCSHADVYTGLHGVIAVLAALQARERTGVGQHVDVSMAATMLSVNERAGAQMADLDVDGELLALSAAESPIFVLPDGTRLTLVGNPIFTPFFRRYCGVMRRPDLLRDPRYQTAKLRAANAASLMAEIRSWILTFSDHDLLQAQVSEAGMAIGVVRSTKEFSESEWAREPGRIAEVDDRSGGTLRMPGAPWRFSKAELPPAGIPAFQGEHNAEVFASLGISTEEVEALRRRGVALSRRAPTAPFD